MEPRFQIDFAAYFLLAAGLMILPLEWLAAVIVASLFHELWHYCAAKLLGIQILAIRIGAGGILMDLSPMHPREELLIASAGPVGSFALLSVSSVYPQLAVCGFVQGLFNLLPIWPLDGGRILSGLFLGNERLHRVFEIGTVVTLLGLGIWLWHGLNMGAGPVLLAGIMSLKAFQRKIPCIAGELGVQ